MDLIQQLQLLIGTRAAYPIIATLLTFVLQVAKVSPYTKVIYAKVPVGWRWITPVLAGGALGFSHGYQQNYTVAGSLLEMVMGMFGVGATAMGIAAGLKESPIPWDGQAGGVPKPTNTTGP